MGDNRYHELLGLDPAVESPTYYELLLLVPAEATNEAIENHYKEQMTKLQHIKSPKHKGFIEFLKDEIRNAKLTLSNVERRKEYDSKLGSKHTEAFREFAKPFMALGEVPRKVFASIVSSGVSKHGITEAEATKIVEEVMAAAGAKMAVDTDAPSRQVDAHAAEPVAAPQPPRAPTPPPAQHSAHSGEPVAAAAEEGSDPLAFFDQVDPNAAPQQTARPGPTPLATPFAPGTARPPASPSYVGASGYNDHFAAEPPTAAAYGVEDAAPSRAQPTPQGIQRGFGRATPAPAPAPPTPAHRGPSESAPQERAAPAPPSDVSPRISHKNRFYGSEDAYRPGGASTAGGTTSQAPSDGGYRPWGNTGGNAAPSSDAYARNRPSDAGRGSDAYGRASPSDSGRVNDPGRFGSGEYSAARPTASGRQEVPGAATPPAASAAQNARAAYQNQQDAKTAEEARKTYNGGIKLSRLAIQAHVTLAEYFPRTGDMQSRINGVSYEDVLRTEHKMWKEAMPSFQKTIEKLVGSQGPLSDDLRARAEANVRYVEHYLKEWKDLKFKLEFQSVKKGELVRLYRDFVLSKRADALNHELQKLDGPAATT